MNEKFLMILKQAFFLSIGTALIWWSFSKSETSFSDLWDGAKSMDYTFFLVSAIFAIGSHYFRALRWKLLIDSVGYKPRTKNVFASVLFMYASNVAIPRSGEIARCGTLYKYENIPVAKLLGTVFVERAIDLLSLLAFTGLLLIVQFDLFYSIYKNWTLEKSVEIITSEEESILPLIILIFTGCLIFGAFIFRKKITPIIKKVIGKVKELKAELIESLKSVLKMQTKIRFFIHTIIIWFCYVAMFYICFFAFEPTSNLDLSVGLTAFIAGSFGMVAPTNGGIGAWQAMVILALTTLNISDQDATIWANVAFFIMTITIVVAGLCSFAILPFMNRDKKEEIIEA
jgi:glycosyltransferase 2 family protein